MAECKQDTRGHLEMTPIYFYRHYESLFKEYLANRMAPVVNDVEGSLWTEEELWGKGISHVADVLKDFRDKIENTGYKFGSGRCMAYVPNSGNVASCLGELLLGRMDPYHDDLSKAIERSVIYFMCQTVGYPRGADGYVTSGGSTASVIAMAAARDVKKIQAKDYHRLVVYCTARTHTALDKALETVGLGMCHLREVKHDTEQRMIPEELERLIKEDKQNDLIPFVICGTIGTTDLGSIDPMPEIARIAREHDNIWFHVDGAIGGFYALCGQMRDLYAGIEESDSMILDPHKSMSQPYGSGAVLFRKGSDKYVSCLKDEDGKVPIWQNSIENRMMFRTFPFWFSMNALGVRTFRTILERNLELAQYVYDQLKVIPELSVLVPQQCTVAFRRSGATMEEANANTTLLNTEMDEDERVCLSSTKIDGYKYIRICIANYRDHLSEIILCLDEIYTQLEDVLGRAVDRSQKPTTARMDWLKQVEKDLRWKEHDLGVRYLDRLIRLVFNEVIHEDVEKSRLEVDGLQDNLLYVSEEAVDPEKLLTISTAITLRDVVKKQCRFAGALGDFLAVMNNNVSGMQHCAPGAVELEHKIITHLTASFGMDPVSRGVLSPDICTANELAFIAARQSKFAYTTTPDPPKVKGGHKHKRKGRGRRFKKVKETLHEEEEETHLDNTKFEKAVVYTTEEGVTLYANELTLIGLGECTKVAVASTRGVMDAADLEKKIQMDQKNDDKIPWLVIQPIDRYWEKGDIKPITAVCLKYDVWHHVAIGPKNASFLFELTKQTKEAPLQVHSASVDIQKSLSLSLGVAATMVKNHELLFQSMTNHRAPPYLPELPEDIVYEPKTYSFELSRAHKATPLWFTLRLLGTKICCSEL